jgi:hypothetical protein
MREGSVVAKGFMVVTRVVGSMEAKGLMAVTKAVGSMVVGKDSTEEAEGFMAVVVAAEVITKT